MIDGGAASALDWWLEAGVDVLVDDAPRDWLAPATPAPQATIAPVEPVAAPFVLPTDLATFRQWMLTDATVPGPAAARLDAVGDPAQRNVVVVDMPEGEDRAAGTLLSGEVGTLFDRMLAAMQLDRGAIYLLPLSPARPAIGRLREADLATLTPLLLHHLALVAPKRLLLLGDAPAQALVGQPAIRARDAVHTIIIGDTGVPAVVSIHPRLVQQQREYRKDAWADLQRFMAL